MQRDLGDIFDRMSIAELKSKRIGNEEQKKEYLSFQESYQELKKEYPNFSLDNWYKMMLNINDFIWQLESGLKSGKEELANPTYLLDRRNVNALSNIGVTSLLIRNFNSIRISFKNIINELVGQGFQDVKQDHCSSEEVKK
jgi:hypothetical protein